MRYNILQMPEPQWFCFTAQKSVIRKLRTLCDSQKLHHFMEGIMSEHHRPNYNQMRTAYGPDGGQITINGDSDKVVYRAPDGHLVGARQRVGEHVDQVTPASGGDYLVTRHPTGEYTVTDKQGAAVSKSEADQAVSINKKIGTAAAHASGTAIPSAKQKLLSPSGP
jgi:hypothetical protein